MYINVYFPTESLIEASHFVHSSMLGSHFCHSYLTTPGFSGTSIDTK
jgi:hypothetical protein